MNYTVFNNSSAPVVLIYDGTGFEEALSACVFATDLPTESYTIKRFLDGELNKSADIWRVASSIPMRTKIDGVTKSWETATAAKDEIRLQFSAI